MKSAPCTILRPDASGNLVAVATVRSTTRPPAVIRSGPFVIWDDYCQTTRAGDTLAACAEHILERGGAQDETVVRMASSGVQRLNTAERAMLLRLIQEGSE